MILNSYAVLLAFVAALRLALGLLVIGLGTRAWLANHRSADPDANSDRFYLLLLLALLLLGLNAASWPLMYLLLQSYVSEFPGVMCIYGVTRIGEGSLGAARHLPGLLTLLQLTKPALMFAGGAWFVLYLLNRQTPTSPLLSRLFVLLLPFGALATVDAVAELTYVTLPKTEERPSSGCCTIERDGDRFQPVGLTGGRAGLWLTAGFFCGTGALVAVLSALSRRSATAPGNASLTLLCIAAIAMTAVGGLFLVDVAAPTLLGLPYHHCPYDLLPRVPEAVVAATLYLVGGFSIGWAWVARQFGSHPETSLLIPNTIQSLLRLGMWCYVASVGMLSLELVLAP
jgi:hypothetical protein